MKMLLNFALAILLLSCTGSDTNKDEEMDKKELNYLVFEFHDSSVPPPYHRSYSLEFKGETVHIVVDSYGDILTDTTVEIGNDRVQEAFGMISQYKVGSKEKNEEEEGCTGGTGISIEYGFDDVTHCEGYVYFCAGEQFGDLTGDLNGLKSDLKALIPDFQFYLKEE